ncbi:MAG: MarR family transcriptional regulator [Pseudomonadota bacterium]
MSSSAEREWPVPRTPAARVVGGLFRSRNYVWDNDHRIVAEYGLSWTQFLVLMYLRGRAPHHVMSPTQLYEATQASSGGMTKALHALVAAGHIERTANPEDRRSRLVKLRPSGAQMAEVIVERLIDTNTEMFGDILSMEECETLAVLLAKLSAGLQERGDRGASTVKNFDGED